MTTENTPDRDLAQRAAAFAAEGRAQQEQKQQTGQSEPDSLVEALARIIARTCVVDAPAVLQLPRRKKRAS